MTHIQKRGRPCAAALGIKIKVRGPRRGRQNPAEAEGEKGRSWSWLGWGGLGWGSGAWGGYFPALLPHQAPLDLLNVALI